MGNDFTSLVDLARIKEMMRLFYELTGFASAILDVDGNILQTSSGEVMGVGWKKMCLDFHRIHPVTSEWCRESDTHLANTVNSGGKAACYHCLNGLVDAASPVVIDGQHLVNLFTGQFFYEPPDEEVFRQRARLHGFDEEAYIAALRQIPVFSPEFVEKGLHFLDMLAAILAEMGLKQRRLMEVNQEIEAKIRERTCQLQDSQKELADLNERLKDLDRVKTDFFSNVSHELRTPLTLIAGPVDRLLTGDAPLSAEQRRDLSVVRQNAQLLLKQVNDLLDVTRLDAGRMDLAYRQADLAAILRRVAGHFDVLAAERSIRVEIKAPPELPAQLDVEKVERVILNLLSNAFKFTPVGGRVSCAVEEGEPGTAVVRVEDSGPGIPADLRQVVFERFHRADTAMARTVGGTGLGLAIVKDFVAMHGGTVVIGEPPGGGTRIEVVLPLAAPGGVEVDRSADVISAPVGGLAGTLAELAVAAARDSADSEYGPANDGRPVVLVVEDNDELRRYLVQALDGEFDVAVARDGEHGLTRALDLAPSVVVTDLMMPRLSGDRMIGAIRADARLAETSILVLSAKSDDRLRLDLLRGGVQDYVVKPFLAEEVRARVANLASLARARQVLRHELDSRETDVALLAGRLAERNRALAKARRQAEAASDAKSRFLAMVSHELRTPLQNLEIYGELLRQTLPEGSVAPRVMAGFEAAAERMKRLVVTILDHSAIMNGRLKAEPTSVCLAVVVERVVGDLGGKAVAKGLQLQVLREESLPPVVTDPDLVHLALTNLVENAIKYTPAGGVTVRLQAESEWQRLDVVDTGIGIDPKDHQRIFEPFHQLEDVAHKHTAGVGLGLAVVREVAELLGGRVELASCPGEGSVFSLLLPGAAEGAQ